MCVVIAQAALADTYLVTSNGDTGIGTLRDAITKANARPGADTIQYSLTGLNAPPYSLLLGTALPTITDSVTIIGPGQSFLWVEPAQGAGNFPIFSISGAVDVEIRGFRIWRGRGTNGGGIAFNGTGSLTVRSCSVEQNSATGGGGGIFYRGNNSGTINIIDSQVLSNTSGDSGGGICMIRDAGRGTINLTNAYIAKNNVRSSATGMVGGGIHFVGPIGPHALNATASTIADNGLPAGSLGGGIYYEAGNGTLTFNNCTISGNVASEGAAMSLQQTVAQFWSSTITANNSLSSNPVGVIRTVGSGSILLKNTILSGNFSALLARDLADNQPVSGNNNLIGVGGTLVNGVSGNIVGVTDPKLAPLAFLGGLAPLYHLRPDSPAIDAGSNADAPAYDGRWQPRPSDGNNDGVATADIGAFETQKFVVTNANDAGAGSLRKAIDDNNLSGGNFIRFAIGAQGSSQTIALASQLPTLWFPVVIDGWSQGGPNYKGSPKVEIDGNAVASATGLDIATFDCIVRGLAINRFNGTDPGGVGVTIRGNAGLRNWIHGCYVGVGLDGTTNRGHGDTGISIGAGANNNLIGSNGDGVDDAAERMVISGSSRGGRKTGVYIRSNSNAVTASNIGVNALGTGAIPNGAYGVWIDQSATANRVGSGSFNVNPAGETCIISGNTLAGVNVSNQCAGTTVAGCLIGVDATGTGAIPNGVGISVSESGGTTIGGASASVRNVISGNTGNGLFFTGAGANNCTIAANLIGLNAAGTGAIPNGGSGIVLASGASGNRIGTNSSDVTLANVVSGNAGRGIEMRDAATNSNTVWGNFIGLDRAGTARLANAAGGILISDSSRNQIGGTGARRNVISGNGTTITGHGIEVTGAGASANTVQNNFIGLDASGALARGNAGSGISLANGAVANLVGGAAAGLGNTIANNTVSGIRVLGSASTSNAFVRNSIIGNSALGIDLAGDGVTSLGAAGVVRTGPNRLANYPVIQSITSGGTVTATLSSTASATFRIEFFSSSSPDATLFGQGRTYLGSVNVTTNSAGVSSPFTFTFAPTTGERFITATATELASQAVTIGGAQYLPGDPLNTSEFSQARVINTDPVATPQTASGREDTDLVVTLAATDVDTNPNGFQFSVTSLPARGQLFQFGASSPITAVPALVSDAGGRVVFRPAPNQFSLGYDSFAFLANDGADNSLSATVTVDLAPVADTPSVTNASATKSTMTTSGLVITRNAVDGPEVTHFKITAITNGTLFQNDGVTPILNNAFITAAQGAAGLRFLGAPNFVGSGTFNVQASLSASDAGLGGANATATIALVPLPGNVIVTNATTNEDTLSTGGLTIVRNANDGAEVTHFKITNVVNGSLFLSDGTTPVASNSFITASQGNAGLRFMPTSSFFGEGSFFAQGSLSATDAGLGATPQKLTVTVSPVADTPSITDATTLQGSQSSSGLVITRNPSDGPEVTHYQITAITNGVLYLNDGVTAITSGSFVTAAQGSAGLRFTPGPGFYGQGSFSVQASTSATLAGLGGGLAPARITVTPLAARPTITGATTLEDTLSAGGLVITRNAINGAEITHYKIVGVTNGTLFKSDGVTAVPLNSFITLAEGSAGLRFRPSQDYFGQAQVSVRASIGAVESGVGVDSAVATITVTPVNDPPVFSASNPPATVENNPLTVSIPLWAMFSPGPSNETDSVSAYIVTNVSNNGLFVTPPAVSNNGTLTYTLVQDNWGTSTFTVRVRDSGGTLNGGNDLSSSQTFTIAVLPVNQAPTFVANDPPAVLEATGAKTAPFIAGFSTGPVNEGSQRIVQYVVDQVSRPSLFLVQPTVSTDGMIRYTLAPSGYGVSTFRVRAQDDGGTQNGGSDMSQPQVFRVTVRPAALARDVTLDATRSCPPSLKVAIGSLNATPTDNPPGATQTITADRDLNRDFSMGETPVRITAAYSDGLVSTAIAKVTLLGTDCNANGLADTCEIAAGLMTDCNNDGVPDACQCIWDNGPIPSASAAPSANGQLSHLGGAVVQGAKAADDFYLPPGGVYRIFGFTAGVLTNSFPGVRKARLELYEDCDGKPVPSPFFTLTSTQIINTVPASNGFDLVTYAFDFCTAPIFLDGGKSYWISVFGLTDAQGVDSSYWASTTPTSNATGVMGAAPCKTLGVLGSSWPNFTFNTWEPADQCCLGCVNLAFSIRGELCPKIWENGDAARASSNGDGLGGISGTGLGGTFSGANRTASPPPRTADNFVTRPCKDQDVCLIDAVIYTDCNPVKGFVEIYSSDCRLPVGAPIATLTPTVVIPLNISYWFEGREYPGYTLRVVDPPLRLQGGKTYWISAGAYSGGSLNVRSFFAYSWNCKQVCDYRLSPGAGLNLPTTGTTWKLLNNDYAFRIYAKADPIVTVNGAGGTGANAACPGDFNRDTRATVQDIFDFLAAWFLGCP